MLKQGDGFIRSRNRDAKLVYVLGCRSRSLLDRRLDHRRRHMACPAQFRQGARFTRGGPPAAHRKIPHRRQAMRREWRLRRDRQFRKALSQAVEPRRIASWRRPRRCDSRHCHHPRKRVIQHGRCSRLLDVPPSRGATDRIPRGAPAANAPRPSWRRHEHRPTAPTAAAGIGASSITLDDRQRLCDLALRHFEDQLVVHLQHLGGELGLRQRRLDPHHGAADDVGGRGAGAR